MGPDADTISRTIGAVSTALPWYVYEVMAEWSRRARLGLPEDMLDGLVWLMELDERTKKWADDCEAFHKEVCRAIERARADGEEVSRFATSALVRPADGLELPGCRDISSHLRRLGRG